MRWLYILGGLFVFLLALLTWHAYTIFRNPEDE